MAAEHSDHAHAVQRQALQQQLHELDMALKELANAPRAYRFVGGLLVGTDVATLKADLERKRENAQTRLDALARHTH